MERILFSTEKEAREYAERMFPGMEIITGGSGDTRRFDFDDSMGYIIPCDGEFPTLAVRDKDYNEVAYLGYWEEGGDYVIYKDGEPFSTFDHWARARHEMIKMRDENPEASFKCRFPGGQTLTADEI